MANLAALFAQGRSAQDLAQARLWYERAATLGLPRAMNALGELYLTGAGGPRNAATAKELFEKAAEQDEAAAMRNLGLIYLLGQGVERDETSAKYWFERAAAFGDQEAQINLSRFEEAARAGYSSLGAQLIARRATCTQSCRATHRVFITSVCDRFFAGAPVEEGDRRNCIDLSLGLSQRCTGSCRNWAQSVEKNNPCEVCYREFVNCAGDSTPVSYSEIARRCTSQIDNCSAICRSN